MSFFEVVQDRHRKMAEVAVQSEPASVAFHPNGRRVSNTVSGTVTVLLFNPNSPFVARALTHVSTGVEPTGIAPPTAASCSSPIPARTRWP